MGLAAETIGFSVANPSSTYTAVTMSPGDSNRVREFTQGTDTRLLEVFRQGATAGAWRIMSSTMHDPIRGLTFLSSENPFRIAVAPQAGDPMQSGDTLTIQGTGGTAETEVGALTLYYQDVLGLAARLYSWPDILGAYEHLKTVEVDCTPNGSAGTWADTALNATEDLLKADRKYAVLGYMTDTAVCAVGVRGGEVGNVRLCGPGVVSSDITSYWYVEQSNDHGKPMIPVISANNKGSSFVSILTNLTSGTVKVSLLVALLRSGF